MILFLSTSNGNAITSGAGLVADAGLRCAPASCKSRPAFARIAKSQSVLTVSTSREARPTGTRVARRDSPFRAISFQCQ